MVGILYGRNYNIIRATPFKRDPLKELAEACKEENIKMNDRRLLPAEVYFSHEICVILADMNSAL